MPHDLPLITTLVAGLGLAFVLGAVANRLRIPPLVGYLLAGIAVGPYTPGFVADQTLATELAELGVILLMFGVGLHFSLKDLISVSAIAIPGALVQITCATAMGAGLAWWIGWPIGTGLVFGMALSVASTVVLLRALQERRLIDTRNGRIAVGWLLVEDLAMVLALVLMPALASALGTTVVQPSDTEVELLETKVNIGLGGAIAFTLLKVVAFIALMLLVGRRVIPWILHFIAHTGSRELFRLAVLSIALGVAFGAAQLFDVSFALGAFFAGMIMSESDLSQRAAEESLPLRDAFSVLFFVAVGMLFDPAILIEQTLFVLVTVFIIVIGKSIAAFLIVRAFRNPVTTAILVSASLAQIGEFSFILAALGVHLNLLPEAGRDLILAGAILSILLNPLLFAATDWVNPWLVRRSAARAAVADRAGGEEQAAAVAAVAAAEPAPEDDSPPAVTALTGHTVLVGFGRVGSLVGDALQKAAMPFLVIEDADRTVSLLKERGIETIVGNAAGLPILQSANIAEATRLIVAIPNAFEAGQIIMQARTANPDIATIARAHSDAEVDHLTHLGAGLVIMGEREIARAIIDSVIGAATAGPEPAEAAQ
ncbi:MAG: YbaL family putative K(+) efflux transporter [Alphaproteobacteria bacterium]